MPTLAEQIIPRRKLLLMASETAIFSAILFFGTSLEPVATRAFEWNPFTSDFLRGVLSCVTVALLCQASLSYNDLYDWKVSQNRSELPNRLMHSAGYALLMIAAVVLLVPSLFHFPGLRDVASDTYKLIVLVLLGFAVVWAWRAGFHWFFYKWNFGERVLILGSGTSARETARLIREHPMSGFEVRGLVGDPADGPGAADDPPVLGEPQRLAELAAAERVARVVVALEERRGTLPVQSLLACRLAGITVEETEAMYERITGKIAITSLRPSYLIFQRGFVKHPVTAATKRVIDIVASLVGLLASFPICVLTALLIKLDSRGPVFFKQERVGQDGEIFNVLKFRTMRVDAERESGPVWAQQNDPRVTRIGRILRLTRIDEIPQMVNVLIGNMSFVGPRPERPKFVDELSHQNPYYVLRHTVKPGLTGWAQVMHHYGASYEDALEKLRFDLYYIKNMSPFFDLNIILRTGGVVLFGKGAR
jgi:sugar transferase (PEP-CTERM system associated)